MSITVTGSNYSFSAYTGSQSTSSVQGTSTSNLLGVSRASGTVYTNSTGKPLVVLLSGTNVPANGNVIGNIGGRAFYCMGYGTSWAVTYVIPNGETYKFTNNNANIQYWYEI